MRQSHCDQGNAQNNSEALSYLRIEAKGPFLHSENIVHLALPSGFQHLHHVANQFDRMQIAISLNLE